MNNEYGTILTSRGLSKFIEAITENKKIDFFEVALGDAEKYLPAVGQTELRNELSIPRIPISHVQVESQYNNRIKISIIIPAEIGGFLITEIGVYDEEEDLIAIGTMPQTYKPLPGEGSTKELSINLIIEVVNTDVVELKIDPNVIVATKKDLEQLQSEFDMYMEGHDQKTLESFGGIHGMRLQNDKFEYETDGSYRTIIDIGETERQSDKLRRLEDAVFSNITGNPFEITLGNLDGLVVTGIWNQAKNRLEV